MGKLGKVAGFRHQSFVGSSPTGRTKNSAGKVLMVARLFCTQEDGDRYLIPAPEGLLYGIDSALALRMVGIVTQ